VRRVSYSPSNARCYQCEPISRGAFHLAKVMRVANASILGDIEVPGRAAGRRLNPGEILDGHRAGYGVDLGIKSGPQRLANGSRLANWLVQNAEAIGIQLVVWTRTAWVAGGAAGGRWAEYTGESPHEDHVHLDLSPAGAMRQTAWFAANPEPANMSDSSRWLVYGTLPTTRASGAYYPYGPHPAGSTAKPFEFDEPTAEEMLGTGKFGSDEEARWLLQVQTGVIMPTSVRKNDSSLPLIIISSAAALALVGIVYAVTRE